MRRSCNNKRRVKTIHRISKPVLPRAPLTLTCARCGEVLRVVGVNPQSRAGGRLKELGFCEAAEVQKLTDGSALLCQIQGVRLAIGRELGADVYVEEVRP